MPNHVHLLIGVKEMDLVEVIRRWKLYTTNQLHKAGLRGKIWQRSFWDHGMRKNEDIQKTARYVLGNPVRAGLADTVDGYSYSYCKWNVK